ncbi:MAG: hypothetical protein Q4C53_09115 [Clostridia bacterium]|nr:hypothetical protein [Clostridia bacterium]
MRKTQGMAALPDKKDGKPWLFIALSVFLILWGIDGLLGAAVGIAALVFAVKHARALKRGDEAAANGARSACGMLLTAGLAGTACYQLVGCAALAAKYLFR